MIFSFLSSIVANARTRRTLVCSVMGLIVVGVAFLSSALSAPSAFAATKKASEATQYTYAGQITSSTSATSNLVMNFTIDTQGGISGRMTFSPDNGRSGQLGGSFKTNSTFEFAVVEDGLYYGYPSTFQGTLNADGTMSGTYSTVGYNENSDPTNPNDTGNWVAAPASGN
jgi:hypothetical protein